MKLYQTITASIEDIDEKGRGTANVEGKRIVVPMTFPGDVVRVQPRRREHGVLVCEIDEFLVTSPWRVPPRCPHAARSGGCYWQMADYGKQLEWKRQMVARVFADARIPFEVPPLTPSEVVYEYRNKMEYAVGPGYVVGTKAPGKWWEIIDMDGCLLQSAASGDVVRIVREYLREHQLVPWDCRTHQGFVRYVVIREGKFTGERMVILVTAPGELPHPEILSSRLEPYVTSLYQGVNSASSDTAVATDYQLLDGTHYLKEQIGSLSFFIHPNSFFQTNSFMVEPLLEVVSEFANMQPHERLLDLYCGLGLFSFHLAPYCHHVMGIEVVPEAIDMAVRNQENYRISNIQFKLGKVEDLTWVGPLADAAIIDPPRAGLHPHIIEALVRFGPPRLVYVCCNPRAFAREYPILASAYSIKDIRALDLFPHSPHLELVVKMERM